METVENKYITVAYKLYAIEDGEKDFTEESTAEHPFQFISGLGLTLESFEDQVKSLKAADCHFYLRCQLIVLQHLPRIYTSYSHK